MMDALSSIRCFHLMEKLTRSRGHFTRAELVEAGFKDFHVRSYLTLCRSRRAIERRFNLPQQAAGGVHHAYRVIETFPPVTLTANDDIGALSALVLPALARSGRDREAFARQKRLWIGLRTLRQVSHTELAFAASVDGQIIAPRQSLSYLADLASAGYVARSAGQYRLLPQCNTGPHPVLTQAGRVLDLNLMRAVNVTASPIGRVA